MAGRTAVAAPHSRLFMLSPVPEPATMATMLLGLALLTRATRLPALSFAIRPFGARVRI
ncbi:PEP-CTERM sorting domain-containing protein [Aquabacterium sp.]|uniref:PEP-CTERM sorting domain-containing protein n=1 Tax=Aquabacterium sp. TaxID=1872578 RepID=UPI002C63BC26|nr:PEP-CTERM sorting domain-containing protein [Aquabacterium sp.]HSW05697.1 PEP-CTERM sorting domain-containing protein [Aquabacterium sp.]